MKNKLLKILKNILYYIQYFILFLLLTRHIFDLINNTSGFFILNELIFSLEKESLNNYSVLECGRSGIINYCKNQIFYIGTFFITFIFLNIKINNFLKHKLINDKHFKKIIVFIISFYISVFITYYLLDLIILSYLKFNFMINREILIHLFSNNL